MSKLPTELLNKNDADFVQITESLREALAKIEVNPKLKATQAELAKISGVSRGTINFRKWPLEELKRIKLKRVEDKKIQSEQPTPEQKNALTMADLQHRLYLSREEVRYWKDKHDQANLRLVQQVGLLEIKNKQISVLEDRLADVLNQASIFNISTLDFSKKYNLRFPMAA